MSGLRLALLGLVRRPVSSALAVISLVIPLAAVGLMATLLVGSQQSLRAYDGTVDAIVGPKTPDLRLLMTSLFGMGHEENIVPYELLRHAREGMDRKTWIPAGVPGGDSARVVRQATPIMEFAMFEEYKVVGTDVTFLDRPDEDMERPIVAEGAWFSGQDEVVVGSRVARASGLGPGATIVATSRLRHPETDAPLWSKTLTVTGVLRPTGVIYDSMLYTGPGGPSELYDAAIRLNLMHRARNNMGISYVLIWLYEGQEEALRSFFDNYTVAKTVIVGEQMDIIDGLIGRGALVGTIVGAISATLGLLCVMVLFNARFEAMGEDLAVMRALGYGKRRIGSWLLWESLLVWLAAVPVAVFVEWLLAGSVGHIPAVTTLNLALSWPTVLHPWIWGLSLVGCPLAVTIPLIRLYRHNVHEALKGM